MKLHANLFGSLFAIAFAAPAPASAASVFYDGIEFPGGDASFADVVVDYTTGDGVTTGWDDPNDVLGAPDYDGTGAYSLGLPGVAPDNTDGFGSITIQFTDNSLTTSGDAVADLHIFEIGNAVEQFLVEISVDMFSWISLGILSGQPTSIDIDSVAGVTAGAFYSFVRLTDVDGGQLSGAPFAGPDIDAIGAISSAPPVDPPSVVPLPAAGWLLLGAVGGLGLSRRRG